MPIGDKRWNTSKDSVDAAMDVPGVYALYVGAETIYIGSSEVSIRTRLQRHMSGQEGSCTQRALSYSEEACSNPLAREAELIAAYKRINGRLPRCNEVQPRA